MNDRRRSSASRLPCRLASESRATLGREPLRFVALYAGTDVVTHYAEPVQPDGRARAVPAQLLTDASPRRGVPGDRVARAP